MSTKNYKDKMKALRGLVDFDYDLRKPLHPRQKGKIDKYWRELQEAKGQPYRIYRPKSKDKLKAVQDVTGMELKGWKVAIIPDPDPQNPFRVEYEDGQVTFSGKHSTKIFQKFSQQNLVQNPEAEIERVLSNLKGSHISIACGKFEYRSGRAYSNVSKGREDIKSTTIMLMNSYNNPEANNYFQNWLHGLYDITIKNQQKVEDEKRFKQIYQASTKKQRQKLLMKKKKNVKKKNSNGRLRD